MYKHALLSTIRYFDAHGAQYHDMIATQSVYRYIAISICSYTVKITVLFWSYLLPCHKEKQKDGTKFDIAICVLKQHIYSILTDRNNRCPVIISLVAT